MTNEIKQFLSHPPFNKKKWGKKIKEFAKIPEEASDINHINKYLFCLAAFCKLSAKERQTFLLDPANKSLVPMINQWDNNLSLQSAQYASELLLELFIADTSQPMLKK